MRQIIVFTLFFQLAIAMLIPEDTEMLEGYGSISFPDISPEDDYFEARSLSAGPLYNAVRNKRAIGHEEKAGLTRYAQPNVVNEYARRLSHSTTYHDSLEESSEESKTGPFRKLKLLLRRKFAPITVERKKRDVTFGDIVLSTNRHRRSVDNEKNLKVNSENSPMTLKLSKASSKDSPTASALVGKFARSPFEYSKIQHEEDSMAMDGVNEGIKSRTPRVNFVTQQKKSLDHDDIKTSATKSDFYKTPPLLHNSKESTAASSSDRYPEKGSTTRPSTYDYKDRDINSNRYDDRYIEDMYPPPPETYDPMFDNIPYDYPVRRFPYSGYNNYPGSRYDTLDYKDYPPMYGNEIDSRYYMRSEIPHMIPPALSPSSALPRKRTIYYAYLPEVVRSPPTVDFRYRSYNRYEPYYPDSYNSYDANMMGGAYRRPMFDKQTMPERASIKYDYRTSKPMKVNYEDTIRNSSSIKEKRFDQERQYRKSDEYDPYYY